ncbi:MAG: alpha/beta fold hydrolase [Magnetococcales bacterium]|nr:alpha/beta fold hydrolase [Magnetococcales bacterium]
MARLKRWWVGSSLLGGILLASAAQSASLLPLRTAEGYVTEAEVHDPAAPPRATVILLHGKGGKPQGKIYVELASRLAEAGCRVVVPRMPWSRWDAPFESLRGVVDAAIATSPTDGKPLALVGHSLGGAAALHYGAGTVHPAVTALATLAPGHFPHSATKLRQHTEGSVQRARVMAAEGRGEESAEFTEVNTGVIRPITMTAATYRSYYDPEIHPEVMKELPRIRLPLLWIGGEQDDLTRSMDYAGAFARLQAADSPAKIWNRLLILPETHTSVVPQSASALLEWFDALPGAP